MSISQRGPCSKERERDDDDDDDDDVSGINLA